MKGVLLKLREPGRVALVVLIVVAVGALVVSLSVRYQRAIERAAAEGLASASGQNGAQMAAWMKEGIDVLDKGDDPASAAALFRRVLAVKPDHYGANYQLAEAVYRSEGSAASASLWRKVLEMANGYNDSATASTAQQRLAGEGETPELLMRWGMDALYRRAQPEVAIPMFRRVLEMNPSHYGATYQLATALGRAGSSAEARELWPKVLQMAESYQDEETAATARRELARDDASNQ